MLGAALARWKRTLVPHWSPVSFRIPDILMSFRILMNASPSRQISW
jgi:hypothetical protein